MNMRTLTILALTGILGLLLSACGGGGLFAPPTATPTASSTPAPTATATLTPTPTQTATPTFTPTATNTPRPTSTPNGFYENGDLGFSTLLPFPWEVALSLEDVTILYSTSPLMDGTLMALRIADTSMTADDFMLSVESMLRAQYEQDSLYVSFDHAEEVTLHSGQTMEKRIYQMQGGEQPVQIHLLWAPRQEDVFALALIVPEANLQLNETNYGRIFTSLSFIQQQAFSLPPEETALLLGGKPEPQDLNPARTQGSAGGYVGLLYRGLVRLKPDMQVAPDLAEGWQIGGGGTVYTFTLRAEARFADGTPITAQDVKSSWEYAAKPGTDSQTVTTYLGDIVGLEEAHSGASPGISGVQALDDRTLVVTLDAPKPYFLAKLTYPVAFVVDTRQVYRNPADWMFDPNSSGPYTIKEQRDNAIVLERNPQYHAPASIPYLVFRYYLTGDAVSTFQAGDLDATPISLSDAAALRRDASNPLRERLQSVQSMCTPMYLLNTTMPPFDDLNVRRAFALALDRQRLIEQFSEGLGAPALTILPPGMPGYTEANAMPAYDPQAARQALADSAYADGLPEITLLKSGFASQEDPFTTAVVNMWQETLGARVTVQYVDPLDILKTARQTPAHLVSFGWCADYPDPQNFLDVLFGPQSDFNVSNYQNAEVAALLEQANTSLDPAQRIALYQQAEALILNDFAVIPLVRNETFALVSERLEGFVLTPIGVPIWDSVRLKP